MKDKITFSGFLQEAVGLMGNVGLIQRDSCPHYTAAVG